MAEPFIFTFFLTQLANHPANNPEKTAPKNPAFVLVDITPPTKPAARPGFPAIEYAI